MSLEGSDFAAIAHLLPEARLGTVTQIAPIALGLSGAKVYAVSSSLGEWVLRINAPGRDTARWTEQLLVLRRAAEHGVAPALVHVDDTEQAVVSARISGVPLGAALSEPAQRATVITSVVAQLRALHALDGAGLVARDPVAAARAQYAAQRARPGFPEWALELDQFLNQIASILDREPRRVVSHQDLNPGNVIWDGTRAWLIDWDESGLAHPFFDLATLALFLQLDERTALSLLAQQERSPLEDGAAETFAALRRFAALFCGLVFSSLIPDLAVLRRETPTLGECYTGLRTGTLDLQQPSGQAQFALAMLRLGRTPADANC